MSDTPIYDALLDEYNEELPVVETSDPPEIVADAA